MSCVMSCQPTCCSELDCGDAAVSFCQKGKEERGKKVKKGKGEKNSGGFWVPHHAESAQWRSKSKP